MILTSPTTCAEGAPRAGRCCRGSAQPRALPRDPSQPHGSQPRWVWQVPSQNAEFGSDPALRNPRIKQKTDPGILQNPMQESQVLTKAEKVNNIRKQASSTWTRRAQAIKLIGMNSLFLTCEQHHQISQTSEKESPAAEASHTAMTQNRAGQAAAKITTSPLQLRIYFNFTVATINKVQDLRVLKKMK